MVDAYNMGRRSGIIKWILSLVVMAAHILVCIYIIKCHIEEKLLTSSFGYVLTMLGLFIVFLLIQCKLHGIIKGITLKSKIINILYFLCVPLVSLLIEEIIWNESWAKMSYKIVLLNYALVTVLTLCICLMITKIWCAYAVVLIFHWMYGLINHYVLIFKGRPPLYTDLVAVKTAMTVMGNYVYEMTDYIIYGSLLLFFSLLMLRLLIPADVKLYVRKKRFHVVNYIMRLIMSVGLIIAVLHINVGDKFKLDSNPWDPTISIQYNGAPLSMLTSYEYSHPSRPDGYSKVAAQRILSGNEVMESESRDNMQKAPIVIVIMNESFSDLNTLGEINTDDCLQFWNSSDDYVMRGNVYTSVVGGGTCNSEFEFLTGSSMANIGAIGYPYRSYNLVSTFNISEYLKNIHGYYTMAFHPYLASNWNRTIVYKNFGFDDFISSEDMSDEEFSYINWGESDDADYNKVIQIVENNQQQPLFLFNVTMQNHGGYLQDLQAGYELVSVADKYAGYKDVVNYLTLIRESDHAYEKLITYLEGLDRPVLLCMFGDHQPALDDAFVEDITSSYSGDSEIEKREQRYITPYMIWSNYDTGIEQMQKDMSLNYLGANLLDIMGYRTSYTNYLLNLETEIPVMNAVGYQTKDDVWHGWEEENNLINEYKIVQYYETFDRNDTEY